MPILFAGTSIADFEPVAGTRSSTTAFIAPNALEGVINNNSTSRQRAPFTVPANEFWFSAYMFMNITGSYQVNLPLIQMRDDTAPALSVYTPTSQSRNLVVYYNPGSGTLVQIGPAFGWDNSLARLDMYVKQDPVAGRITIYRDGIQVYDYTGDTQRGWNPIQAVDFGNVSGNDLRASAVMAHTQDTRQLEFVQLRANANGAQSQWTGAGYTAINEDGYNDTSILSSNVAGDVSLFGFTDLPSGYDTHSIAGVVVAMRAQGSGVPGGINGVARIGGVNYEQAPVDALDPAWAPHRVIFETNPATSAGWTQAQINAAEFGVKSV